VPLSPEKQAAVMQHVEQENPPEAQTGGRHGGNDRAGKHRAVEPAPGQLSEVPTVTSYKFLLTGKSIAVVDPESRKVIQIIPN
jgi:hypothetical protein